MNEPWCATCNDKGRVFDPEVAKIPNLGMGAAMVPCPACPGLVTVPKLYVDALRRLASNEVIR